MVEKVGKVADWGKKRVRGDEEQRRSSRERKEGIKETVKEVGKVPEKVISLG